MLDGFEGVDDCWEMKGNPSCKEKLLFQTHFGQVDYCI